MSLAQYSAPNAPFVDASGRLTYAGHKFLQQVWERIGGADAWSIGELMQVPAQSTAVLDVLSTEVDAGRLSTEVAELRALVEELSRGDIEGQFAQLREQFAYMGAAMRRKRTVQKSIVLGTGVSSATYTISPALSSVDLADLVFLGATASTGGTAGDSTQVAIELTDATTVTARRNSTNGTMTAYFRLTEYTQ